MKLAGIGLTLALSIVTGKSHLTTACAQQMAQTGAEDGDAVLKIGEQRIEKTPL